MKRKEQIILLTPHFDRDYYLTSYPDVAKAGIDPVEHYLNHGWAEGRDPHPEFSTRYYLETNQDISEAGINPFEHYIVSGKAEGRLGRPRPEASGTDHHETKWKEQINLLTPHFDRDYYLASNSDVAKAGIDPIEHYLIYGWVEGRDPHPEFSTRFYLEANPDVSEAGVNPFEHYIVSGKAEGRTTIHPGGWKAHILGNLLPLERQVQEWTRQNSVDNTIEANTLRDRIYASLEEGAGRLIIGFGHDNYLSICGGVQICIQREAEAANAAGIAYLNIHPWQPLPRLAHQSDDPDPLVCLILDGDDLGSCRMSVIISLMDDLKSTNTAVDVVVHSLLGHMPEQIVQIVQSVEGSRCWFWLHDFFTLCPSFTLQRNLITYCDAPDESSNACHMCCFGEERGDHRRRIQAFFEALSVHLLAPSKMTKKFWLEKAGLPHVGITAVPHMKLRWMRRASKPKALAKRPIRIGYIGAPLSQKGWQIYQKIFREHQNSELFRFYYFGNHDVPISIRKVSAHVTQDNNGAMIEALAEAEIDLVLHWSSCPETFSFTTHEALASGAYVVTNELSGNVAATIRRLKRGMVLKDENELMTLFRDEIITKLVDECRKLRDEFQVNYTLSKMSIPFILGNTK